jgi:hypothetical protein
MHPTELTAMPQLHSLFRKGGVLGRAPLLLIASGALCAPSCSSSPLGIIDVSYEHDATTDAWSDESFAGLQDATNETDTTDGLDVVIAADTGDGNDGGEPLEASSRDAGLDGNREATAHVDGRVPVEASPGDGAVSDATAAEASVRDGAYPLEAADSDSAEVRQRPCVPTQCGTHSWACWPMPNAPRSGLPNPASYTDLGDNTIRDNVTCLIWDKIPATNVAYTWSDSKLRCTGNPLHDGVGWRVPTRIELMSLVDYSKCNPAVDKTFFPQNLSNPPYWTASAMSAIANFGYLIKFYDGVVNYADQASMYFAQCVRGNGESPDLPITPPGDHYTIGSSDVVDNYTGLVWQRDDSQALSLQPISSQDAIVYCQTLGLNGQTWRLPSVKELATLIDETRLGQGLPLVDPSAFAHAAASDYWSSTTVDSQSWTASFQDGSVAHTATTAFARCVH